MACGRWAPVAGVLMAAGLVVSGVATAASGLPTVPPGGGDLPRECTSSGLDVLCVWGTPSAAPITFTVPEGVSALSVFVAGGAGGDGPARTSIGGFGGTASSVLLVRPGDRLDLRVGGRGGNATMVGSTPALGGVNGGGAAGTTGVGGGGGRTEIHARPGRGPSNPLTRDPLIAAGGGGGGGAAAKRSSNGGNGGGAVGRDGLANVAGLAGHGGSASSGGAGAGGTEGVGARGVGGSASGAGGGGGYFGGGAGNATARGAVPAASVPNGGIPTTPADALPADGVPNGAVPGLVPERTGGAGGGSGFGPPGTFFGVAPRAADGIIELRFKRFLTGVDLARICDPGGPVPPGWILREGSDGDDVLVGSEANDLIRGRFGKDRIEGDAGDDILCGDAGADVLRGGDGNDLLIGGGGRDKLNGGVGADRGVDANPRTVRVRVEVND